MLFFADFMVILKAGKIALILSEMFSAKLKLMMVTVT